MNMVRDDDWDGWHKRWSRMLEREMFMQLSWSSWSSESSNTRFTYTPYDWEWISKNKRLVIATIISIILTLMFPFVGIPLFIYFAIKAKKSYDSFIREKIEKMQKCDNKQESK